MSSIYLFKSMSDEGVFMNFGENPVRLFLQKRMKDFVFRKIAGINHRAEFFHQASRYTPCIDGSEHCEVIGTNPQCFKDITKNDMEKSVELLFTFFDGSTTETKTRNDNIHSTIYFSSNDVCKIDPVTMQLTKLNQTSHVLPRIGDIVCGIVREAGVDRAGKPIVKKVFKHKYKYIKWFICSEQFLRAWTLIMYDKHEVLEKYAKSEDSLRKKMFSGNKLTTNSFKKWTMLKNIQRETITKKRLQINSSNDNQSSIIDENNEKLFNAIYEEINNSDAELNSKYFRLRYEDFSIQHIHILCAIILIGRYGVFPSHDNIPLNLNFTDQLKYWDLPKDYVKQLLENSQTPMSRVIPLRYPIDAPKRSRHDINNEEFVLQLKNIEISNAAQDSSPSYKDAVLQKISTNLSESSIDTEFGIEVESPREPIQETIQKHVEIKSVEIHSINCLKSKEFENKQITRSECNSKSKECQEPSIIVHSKTESNIEITQSINENDEIEILIKIKPIIRNQ